VTVTYKITNTGTETITSVVLTDPLTGEKYPAGDIAPGQTVTVVGKAFIVPESSSATKISKDVTITVQTSTTSVTISRTGILGISVGQRDSSGLTKTGESDSVASLVAATFLLLAITTGTLLITHRYSVARRNKSTKVE